MASRPKRCLEELKESVEPTLSAMALPMEQQFELCHQQGHLTFLPPEE